MRIKELLFFSSAYIAPTPYVAAGSAGEGSVEVSKLAFKAAHLFKL